MAVNYTTPEAMGAAIREAARNTPGNTGDAIRRFYYDRFLCRIFSDDTSPFVLKGGQMLLARLSGARYTRDIDMVSSSLLPDEEVDLLIELTSKDLGDFISFMYGVSLSQTKKNIAAVTRSSLALDLVYEKLKPFLLMW